jgi:lipopolysaccharide assembly outer membrane protein LptD (OstA)
MFRALIIFFISLFVAAVAGLPFEVEADRFKLVNKGDILYASGNVVVGYKQYSLKSNDLQYVKKNNELKLVGDVSIYDRHNNHLMADSLRLFLDSEEGEILNGHIKTNKDYIIQSKRIVLNSDVIELKECTITTCQSLSPEWYFKSQFLSVNRRNNFINADQNTLYFYGLPVFYIPSFSQSVSDETLSNRPTPEFGYNQIDQAFFNVYIGYTISKNITGKVGVGTSQGRGFRTGATHIYTPRKNQSLTIKTYDVHHTGFEGGVSYRWRNEEDDSSQHVISALFIPSENKTITALFSVDYLFDTSYYNELYHSLPDARLSIDHVPFYAGFEASGDIATGYYMDRINRGNRHQILADLERDIFSIHQFLVVNNQIQFKDNYYSDDQVYWRRLLNSTSFNFDFLNTKNTLTYTKVLVNSGGSPFIFDTINEVNDDELSTQSKITLLPVILSVNSDYQINNQSFRNFQYSLHWVFQCWQLDLSINTVWKAVSFGISIPNI